MDIIESIKASEEKAESIKREAVLDAQKVIAEEERHAKEQAADIIAEAKKKAENMISQSRAEAEKEAEKIFSACKEDILALEKKAKENFQAATKKFISLTEA